MKVLVCGGRRFNNQGLLRETLDALHRAEPISLIVHGGAAGADTFASLWAHENLVLAHVHYAQWRRWGRSAGTIRNEAMLLTEKPHLVVAFSGGRGTKNMIVLAKQHGYKVMEIPNAS